jgi:hypothetical protein
VIEVQQMPFQAPSYYFNTRLDAAVLVSFFSLFHEEIPAKPGQFDAIGVRYRF